MRMLFIDAAGYFACGAAILGARFLLNTDAVDGYFAEAIGVILLGIALFVLLRQMLVVTLLNVLGIGLLVIEEFQIGYILEDGGWLRWAILLCLFGFWLLTLSSVRQTIADVRRTNQAVSS